MPDQTVTLEWSALEHEHIERGSEWYWALGVLAVCFALTAIVLGDFLFGVVILVAAVTFGLYAHIGPSEATIQISSRGIRIDHHLHRYEDIVSFWVEDDHNGHPHLLVDTTKWLAPNLIIPIHDVDPALVRAYLKEHAEEVPMQEPVSHKIIEFLGL